MITLTTNQKVIQVTTVNGLFQKMKYLFLVITAKVIILMIQGVVLVQFPCIKSLVLLPFEFSHLIKLGISNINRFKNIKSRDKISVFYFERISSSRLSSSSVLNLITILPEPRAEVLISTGALNRFEIC